MINRCNVNFLSNIFITIIFIFPINFVYAANLTGMIRGGSISFLNGQRVDGNYITISNWQPLNSLQPTTEWVPGTFISPDAASRTMVLTNSDGENVTIDMSVSGIQYNLGNASSHFEENSVVSFGSVCTRTDQTGSIATLIGTNCIAQKEYQSDSASTPFQFVRPIFYFDDTTIVDSFRNAGVSSGIYTGTLFVRPFYMFKTPTGSWTYRNALSLPISVSFIYEAASLESVSVIGDGIIIPQYNKSTHTVSGATKYRVSAKGFFSNGIKLNFISGESLDDNYFLSHDVESSGDIKTIPYSIYCNKCDQKNVVVNGVGNLTDNTTFIDGSGESIDFTFNIGYKDIPSSELVSGDYQGSFIVTFEENL